MKGNFCRHCGLNFVQYTAAPWFFLVNFAFLDFEPPSRSVLVSTLESESAIMNLYSKQAPGSSLHANYSQTSRCYHDWRRRQSFGQTANCQDKAMKVFEHLC